MPVVADAVALLAAHDEAVHPRRVVELGAGGEHLGPGLRRRDAGLLEQVGAVIQELHVAEHRVRHQLAAVRRAPALLRVPVAGVAVAQYLLRQVERRVDLLERREEAALVELDRPLRVEEHEVVRALAGAHCVARLLEHAAERRRVELDLVAGLLLVEPDDLLERRVPRRRRDQDRDRRLLADVGERLCAAAGAIAATASAADHSSARVVLVMFIVSSCVAIVLASAVPEGGMLASGATGVGVVIYSFPRFHLAPPRRLDAVARVELGRRVVRFSICAMPAMKAPLDVGVAERPRLLRVGREIVQRGADPRIELLVVVDRDAPRVLERVDPQQRHVLGEVERRRRAPSSASRRR